jgi:hypothetical protein
VRIETSSGFNRARAISFSDEVLHLLVPKEYDIVAASEFSRDQVLGRTT